MKKSALALVITGGADHWAPPRWQERLRRNGLAHEIVVLPDSAADLENIHYAAVWKPPQGILASLPNLKIVFNLGAGVDAIMDDASVPAHVPLVRVVVDDLTQRMTEYVVMHVLMHHRQQPYYNQAQREKIWHVRPQPASSSVRVGILGMGVLGRDSADVLKRLGFDVAGWSRKPQDIPGIACYSGADELADFLKRTDILVCLLPLTPQTRNILDRKMFLGLARDGALGGPILINAGRGGLQNEDDLLASLNDGTLRAASLDVFQTEPLPPESPFWSHPAVMVSPHNAADVDPDAGAAYVIDQIRSYESGGKLRNVVDRVLGY